MCRVNFELYYEPAIPNHGLIFCRTINGPSTSACTKAARVEVQSTRLCKFEFPKQLDRIMRIMHECNEDVLIGMNSSYCRESQKHPEPVYRGSLIDHYKMPCLVFFSSLRTAYTSSIARYKNRTLRFIQLQDIVCIETLISTMLTPFQIFHSIKGKIYNGEISGGPLQKHFSSL